ncbi:septal ring lytic transglycosylase RlpA family protein [Rhodovastum atsumiense]|uniref:Endolytic peptidoglycan transglycosylase RlpA n=2 Tax=Rhodovastum atsumiense TaxID=504468 RepID=A0A5M6IX99_9PROT|nr:septal ring lytic transglycosylase RlpA family protein [Rhodovastum atsumiense]
MALALPVAAHAEPELSDGPALREARKLAEQPPVAEPPGRRPPIDHSGRKLRGKASFYGEEFRGRKMANGKRFNPDSTVAASKSLPLGTVAKVTNLKTGKSAMVRIEDRGPYAQGRVVDLTPKTAKKLDMIGDGVVPVVVAPVAVPQRSGGAKAGAGAAEVPASTATEALQQAAAAAPPEEPQARR